MPIAANLDAELPPFDGTVQEQPPELPGADSLVPTTLAVLTLPPLAARLPPLAAGSVREPPMAVAPPAPNWPPLVVATGVPLFDVVPPVLPTLEPPIPSEAPPVLKVPPLAGSLPDVPPVGGVPPALGLVPLLLDVFPPCTVVPPVEEELPPVPPVPPGGVNVYMSAASWGTFTEI